MMVNKLDKSTPFVSIISGYYNRAHLLDRTIKSILSQTYTNFEFIIFDDCSQDNTKVLLQKYENLNDPRLKIIIHKYNMGFVNGLINAITNSTGEYIAIQSSGDVSLPTRIEKQVLSLETNKELSVVGCHYNNILEEKKLTRTRTPNSDKLDLKALLKGNVFSHGEVMFRKSFYDLAGGYRPEFKFCQDYDLWLRMIQLGPFTTIPEVLFERFIQLDGVSYDPKKVITQFKYNRLAKLLVINPKITGRTPHNLSIDSIISNKHPYIQHKIISYCFRDIIFEGGYTKEMAKDISNPLLYFIMLFINIILKQNKMKPLLRFIQRCLGVNNNG